jgi:hypothetical protein
LPLLSERKAIHLPKGENEPRPGARFLPAIGHDPKEVSKERGHRTAGQWPGYRTT